MTDVATFKHGINGYNKRRCRCDVCQEAKRHAARRRRNDLIATNSGDLNGHTMQDPWRDMAKCRDAPVELFFTDTHAGRALARAYCADCPVRFPCLKFAIDNPAIVGVWGGTNEYERHRIRERRTVA